MALNNLSSQEKRQRFKRMATQGSNVEESKKSFEEGNETGDAI